MKQPDLFGDKEAVERVRRHANPLFMEVALDIAMELAREREEFTAKDIRDAMEVRHPSLVTHDDRAMGAVMRAVKAEGIAVPTDRYVPSGRRSNHNGPVRVWRSRL